MLSKLWPYALGSFVLGLDAYVIAGLLPSIASSLNSTESLVGLGVATFTCAYAITSPLLANKAGQNPRLSLIAALAVFALANTATALSPGILVFLAARAIAGSAAGVFSPLSSSVAAFLVTPEQRGRALSLILAGLATGTVLGVPIGLLIAQQWNWRVTLLAISCIGVITLFGMYIHGEPIAALPSSSTTNRWRTILQPPTTLTLIVTLLTAVASLGLYTYLSALLLPSVIGSHLTTAIWVWGIGGAAGALVIGRLVDSLRPHLVTCILLIGLALAFVGMTFSDNAWILFPSLFAWGMCGWASLGPQQHTLLTLNPQDGATAVATNASANYLGSALGAMAGSFALAQLDHPNLLAILASGVIVVALGTHLILIRFSPEAARAH